MLQSIDYEYLSKTIGRVGRPFYILLQGPLLIYFPSLQIRLTLPFQSRKLMELQVLSRRRIDPILSVFSVSFQSATPNVILFSQFHEVFLHNNCY